MMQKRMMIGLALLLALMGPAVHAEEPSSLLLTDDQIALIRTNCTSVQSNLQRLHSSDALTWYNLVQQYNIISTKLMAPMNSRIALSKADGVALLQTTVSFNSEIDQFNSMYKQYEETTQRALDMKCKEQPVAFFDTITLARAHRAAVRQSVDKINDLLAQYKVQVQGIRAAILSPPATKGAGS